MLRRLASLVLRRVDDMALVHGTDAGVRDDRYAFALELLGEARDGLRVRAENVVAALDHDNTHVLAADLRILGGQAGMSATAFGWTEGRVYARR